MPRVAATPDSLFRQVLERSALPTAIVSVEGEVVWSNPAFASIVGPGASPLGRNLAEVWPLEDRRSAEALRTALSHHRKLELNAVAVQLPEEGVARFVDIAVQPVGAAKPKSSMVTVQDVTERVQEHERAGLFYQAFRTSTNAMEVTDRSGTLVDVNPAFEAIYGYSRAECIGKKPNLVRSPGTAAETYRRLWDDLLDPARGFWSGEIVNRDRMGRERPVLLTITSVRNELGATTHYLGVAVDLTERKAWERAAAHADKLASLGQLAAGVAHEINTPLANVLLVAESIRRKTPDEWVRTRVETIRDQVRVADRIVLGLLDFARRSEPKIVPVDLGVVVHDAVNFVRGKQSPEVEVVERFPSIPVRVLGDRNQLIQVVTNLMNNAYDATQGSGRITLELRQNGAEASLEITDTGPGFSASVLPHLFEPFFTTKAEGHGTGLGLAICHGIVQAHHGTISATNGPEGGARFVLTFPLAPPVEGGADRRRPPKDGHRGAGG